MSSSNTGSFWRAARLAILGMDVLSLGVGLVLASAARYDGNLESVDADGLLLCFAVAALAYVLIAAGMRLHQGRYAIGSVDELKCLSLAVGLAGVTGCAPTHHSPLTG